MYGNKNTSVPPSKIIGIQFGTLSTDEKRNSSVAEITKKETITNGLIVTGGLLDSRMGVLDRGKICPTDGLDYIESPGYNGHIELAKPVFYTLFLPQIVKYAKCTCFMCGRLLINKNKRKYLLEYPPAERLKAVYELCKTMKRCGADNDEDCSSGCGSIQPTKIDKDGLAKLTAKWGKEGTDNYHELVLTPELLLQKFKRISNEDVVFLGCHPQWSRPENMICEVLLVPPPAARPSVKVNAQQRSEDDLTHILAQIVKVNNLIKDKLETLKNNGLAADKNANLSIQTYCNNLQHYIHCFMNNESPNVPPMTQRTGRPLKSILSRLKGKHGRMRGNLMAKRVDFSARSVITADPNISIRQLGVPLKIAKTLTKPVVANRRNLDFLTKLVQNGPNYPGASFLVRSNGANIRLSSLSETDRLNLTLEIGDVVKRHMVDGDPILFNRQPSLHKMSMMCHIAKVMEVGETFRMNVADTKPYNADFDGDEMNLHMPQSDDAMVEIQQLAAVPYQIISPGSNKPIIGIFQDNMVGSALLTRKGVEFNKQTAMNLLMMYNRLNPEVIRMHSKSTLSSFDILSQIMPPLTFKVKNKKFKYEAGANPNVPESPEYNNMVEILDGKYIRGQLDNGVLGTGTKGILHRICNDFGHMNVADFIDDFQNIITDYIKISGFSVGISDLILPVPVKTQIIDKMTEKKIQIKNYIDKVRLGLVENLESTSVSEYEGKIVNLINEINKDCGSIGVKSLSESNRFLTMAVSGSKGSALNIQQMVCFVGPQDINGRRITNGFDGRTLPHFAKYDDSLSARGFVQSSYIDGLNPQEMFFHAMAGRIGLIDTAVKTSTTGYIQRKIIKGMEDLIVTYDMTVRNNKNVIIQFSYGEDSIDTVRVENQEFPLPEMSIQDIYVHFNIPVSIQSEKKDNGLSVVFENSTSHLEKKEKESKTKSKSKSTLERYKSQLNQANDKCKYYTDYMIEKRDEIVKYVFNYNVGNVIRAPVAFTHLINNVAGQFKLNSYSLVDITILETFELIEDYFERLNEIVCAPPNEMFKVLYYFFLSPKELIFNKRFNRAALETLLDRVVLHYKKSIVSPGEMVGMIAAQSIGEPTTQLTLNTFHFAGVSSKGNVTRGVPRVDEIMASSSDSKMKSPAMTIYLQPEYELMEDKAKELIEHIVLTKMSEIVESAAICYEPDPSRSKFSTDEKLIDTFNEFERFMSSAEEVANKAADKSKWVVRMVMNREAMFQKGITMDDVQFVLSQVYEGRVNTIFADFNDDQLVFRIRLDKAMFDKLNKPSMTKSTVHALDINDDVNTMKMFQNQLLSKVILRGVSDITEASVEKKINNYENDAGTFKKKDIYTVQTTGSNLIDILAMDHLVDPRKTTSNNIVEIYHVLGIEAARQTIYNELTEVFEFTGSGYLNYHHTSLFCDRMTYTHKIIPYSRNGTNQDNIGPIAKASFEMTPEMFLKAARHGELDTMKGVSANVMCGQEGAFGTNACQVMLNMDAINAMPPRVSKVQDLAKKYAEIEAELKAEDECASILKHSAIMENTIEAFNTSLGEMGNADNDYELF